MKKGNESLGKKTNLLFIIMIEKRYDFIDNCKNSVLKDAYFNTLLNLNQISSWFGYLNLYIVLEQLNSAYHDVKCVVERMYRRMVGSMVK